MFTLMVYRSIYSWQDGDMGQNKKKYSRTATVINQDT